MILAFSGCVSSPVPASHLSGTIAGQKFVMDFPKNTTITNLTVKIETNGAASLTLGYLSAVNDSNVIGSSFAGQAGLVSAGADAFAKGVAAAAPIVGTVVGAAAKTAVAP